MIAIDTNTNKGYYCRSARKMADYLGLHENTVYEWIKKDYKIKQFDNYLIYLDSKSID